MIRRKFISSVALGALALGVSESALTFLAGGCGVPVATFINMGLQLVSTVLPTIPGIIAAVGALSGKTISQEVVARLTALFTGVQGLFQQVATALNQYQANNDPTLITKIEDILNQIKTNLAAALPNLQITDPATVAKITAVVNSFVDLANNILTIIPSVVNGKVTAKAVPHGKLQEVSADAWSKKFNRAVQTPTSNPDVEAAFSGLKAVPAPAK